MGDVDDGHATLAQALDLGEQQLHLAGGEHRRGLIKNQYMTIADQVAGDLDHLLMADAQLADRGIRVDGVQADLGHGRHRQLAQALAIDPAGAPGQIVEKQVLGHGQGRQQVELLHDHAHAQPLGGSAAARQIRLALIEHVPGGGHFEAADDLRQGALARPVFAGQGQHFTPAQAQVDIAEHRLGVGLADRAD
ncbi:hypothetical protein D9M71_457720 [compost metagenome]